MAIVPLSSLRPGDTFRATKLNVSILTNRNERNKIVHTLVRFVSGHNFNALQGFLVESSTPKSLLVIFEEYQWEYGERTGASRSAARVEFKFNKDVMVNTFKNTNV
ncbi:MAG: hypothetical protein BGO69_01075 [Bacteroidetes bacterium 46-16]|nr:MAG: hypothetical protein BGO69_01075 [Bacteroidetes bacterium 46-16]